MHQGIIAYFEEHLEDDFAGVRMRYHETDEKGHGRQEARYDMIGPVPEDLPDRSRWAGVKAIGVAVDETRRDGKEVGENRDHILSKFVAARRFADAVRGHWGIEDRLHWQLDVTFQEDRRRIRQGHADANLSILRRTALSLPKNETTVKVGIENERLTAGWDERYLENVLAGS